MEWFFDGDIFFEKYVFFGAIFQTKSWKNLLKYISEWKKFDEWKNTNFDIHLQAKSTVAIFLIVWIDWINLMFQKRKCLSLIKNYYNQKSIDLRTKDMREFRLPQTNW